MAYIKVDYNKFEHAASAIDTYVSKHKSGMKKIEEEMNGLSASWQGADYSASKEAWNQINSENSTSDHMLKSLEGYAGFLRATAKRYKNAQSSAIRLAQSLPRW